MSFLDTNGAEFISAKITQQGRKAIAKGAFNIKYFQIGDSEYDYSFSGFSGLLGSKSQTILKPIDKETYFKYPYKVSDDTLTTTYGEPINMSKTIKIRNIVNPSGMVGDRKLIGNLYGAEVETFFERLPFSRLSGTTTLTVSTGVTYQNVTHITIYFDEFGGINAQTPAITNNRISLFYKILSRNGNVLNLDRKLPNYSGKTGNFNVLRNNAENEYNEVNNLSEYCLIKPLDKQQLNPWKLSIIWSKKLIGSDVTNIDESLYNYESNVFVSTKELLGYNSENSHDVVDFSGNTITDKTSFKNDFNEKIIVSPSEQRCLAILHFTENDNLYNDEELTYRYDDFISTLTSDNNIFDDEGYPISDTEYFEVYMPFLLYHRNNNQSIGAYFKMDMNDYYITSKINTKNKILFRYLIDEYNNKVGKVFPTYKIVVFDDQEIISTLDYKSNRNFTLGAPSVNLISNLNYCNSNYNTLNQNFLTKDRENKTFHITYALVSDETNLNHNYLPCNYFLKINTGNVPSNLSINFSPTSFNFMSNDANDFKLKFNAKKLKILLQETELNKLPQHDLWREIDVTSQVSGTTLINPTNLRNNLIVINNTDFVNSNLFDLENLMGVNYLGDTTSVSLTKFGETVPFQGSIKLVRGTDIEQMNFLVNLPSTQFLTTQNPTYVNGSKKLTEICLLDDAKNILINAKLAKPIERIGTQLFGLKIDF
jgi:hypothetical protein